MRIALYEDRNQKDSRITAAINSVRAWLESEPAGVTSWVYVGVDDPVVRDADVAISWGSFDPKAPPSIKRTHKRRMIKAAQAANGGKLVIIEVGFLRRGIYYSVGLDDIAGNGDYSIHETNGDFRHPVDYTSKPRERPSLDDSPVLVLGQIPHDTAIRLGGGDKYMAWLKATFSRVHRLCPGRPVWFRPHPKLAKDHEMWSDRFYAAHRVSRPPSHLPDLVSVAEQCHAVIAYTSTGLIEVVLHGVPVFAADRGCVIWPLCNQDLSKLTDPWTPGVEEINEFVKRLTWYQYTIDELRDGVPFKRLISSFP